jgi:phosphatidate cytidylyltransferase
LSVRTRIATAAPLIGGFLAALFWAPPMLWAGLMLVILFLAAAEWAALHKFDPVPTYAFALLVACIGLFAWEMDWPDKALAYFPAALFWLGVPFLLRRPEHMLPAFVSLALAALLLVSTWMAIVSLRQQSPGVLLAVVGLVIVADSAAYFAGRRFGRHKLAPRISPPSACRSMSCSCWASYPTCCPVPDPRYLPSPGRCWPCRCWVTSSKAC